MIERVISASADGIEVEYDLPEDATAQDRAREWQFPVRVFRPTHGSAQLRNRQDLEKRITLWLEQAKLTRQACGTWYFTWNAFQVECDPDLALTAVDSLDLHLIDVRDGAAYGEPSALGTSTLARIDTARDGTAFSAALKLDPEAIRISRAKVDVVIGKLTREPVTLETALRRRERERITGSLRVTFETDAAGAVRRRVRVTTIDITFPDGKVERETRTDTLERTAP